MRKILTVISVLAVAASENQCSPSDEPNHYAVGGVISEMFNTAVGYPTTLDKYKVLDALINTVTSMQPEQEDFLPKRTSYADAVADIEAWAKERNIIDGVSAKVLPDLGGAIFATKEMGKEAVVFNMSNRHVLSTLRNQDDYKCLGNYIYPEAAYPSLWEVGGLALLLLKHAYDDKSEFRTYIDSLPMEISHPVYFNVDEVAALRGSAVFIATFYTIAEMAAVYAAIYQRLQSNPECGENIGVPLEKFTLKAFRYAFTMALSRNYDGSFLDGHSDRIMIPFWDLTNHNPNAHLDVYNELPVPKEQLTGEERERPTGNYVTYSTKLIKPGEQVFLHYLSPLVAVDAFTIWGFVEVTQLPLEFAITNLTGAQLQLLRDIEWYTRDDFTFYDPEKYEGVVKREVFADLIDILSGKRHAMLTPSKVREAWKLLLVQVDHQMDGYPESLEEYREKLRSADISANLRLVYTQLVAEIEFIMKIKSHLVNVVDLVST